jgi:hypothetical protein
MHERHARELYGFTFAVVFFLRALALYCRALSNLVRSNAVRSNKDCMNAKTIEKASERKRAIKRFKLLTEGRKREVHRVEVPFRLKFSRTEALDTLPIGVLEAERPLAQTSEGALESCQDMLLGIG